MKKNNDFRHFLDGKNKHLKKNHSGNAAKLTAAPWARAENFVKKPPLIVNVTNLELNGFNASMQVSWSPLDPKK